MYQGWQLVFFESKHCSSKKQFLSKKTQKMPARVPIFSKKSKFWGIFFPENISGFLKINFSPGESHHF